MRDRSSRPRLSLLCDTCGVSCHSAGTRNKFALFTAVAVFLSTVILSSCAGQTSAAKPSSPGSGTPNSPSPGPSVGILVATPASLSFGGVTVGSQAMQSVNIENTGTATVNVSQLAITGVGFSAGGSSASSFAIRPGQSSAIQLQFVPQSATAVTGILSVVSDASNSPLTISLSGTGTQSVAAATQDRTVIDKEVGSIFQQPNGFSWSVYGAFDGSPQSLDPAAIRVLTTRFDKFFPGEDHAIRGFPYSALRAYEAQEVAAGRPPIFITTTYMGKKRPVLFSWSLLLQNGVPTAPASDWKYAVNVQDSRFIHFWINRYIQPMMNTYQSLPPFGPNLWFQLDEASFSLSLFGVLDDNNHFVAGVPWDSPFPQNQAEYESGIETFFSEVKTLAPDILTMPNLGSLPDPSQFPKLYANIPGAMQEDIMSWYPNPIPYTRNQWFAQNFSYFSWLGSQGRVANLRALIPPNDPNALPTAFVVYSLWKGPNFFFAPGQGIYNIDPAQWAGMKALLGSPTSAVQSSQPSNLGPGFRLFWRNYQGGTVYLNWTGTTQTIPLTGTHYDPNGNQVTQIQIPDGIGTYVTTAPEALPAPRISPRVGVIISGPLSVTIESDTPGSNIFYTLDGTTPGPSSSLYTGPLQLVSSTVVQARAFLGVGGIGSLTSSASYTVSSVLPTVQFAMASDSGPAGAYYPVLLLSSASLNNVSVGYKATYPDGSSTAGTATFPAGQTYECFPITTSGGANSLTRITITDATGAIVGPTNTFQYSAQ